MTKRLLAFLALVLFSISATAAQIDGVIVAKLRLAANPRSVFSTIPTRGGDLLQPGYTSLKFNNWYSIKVPIGREDQCIATLKQQPGVLLAERSHTVNTLTVTPNDPDLTTNFTYDMIPEIVYPRQWSLDNIKARDGWNIYPNALYTATNRPQNAIRVAVIDTGLDETHEDFMNAGGTSANVISGGQIDFAKGCSIIDAVITPGPDGFSDDHGHGTHVSGIIAASANNGKGIAGIAYQSVIVPIKVLSASGSGNDSDVAIALKYAADQGIPVINLSLGGLEYGSLLMEAVNYTFYKGSIILCAGNESGSGGGNLGNIFPGSCSKVLAVSATGFDDDFADLYSGYGMYVGICAPSGNTKIYQIDFTGEGDLFDYPWIMEIWSTIAAGIAFTEPNTGAQDYTYGWALGTSMATPHVSALAALYTEYKGLTQATHDANLRTFQAIQRGADSTNGLANGGHDYMYGYGRINVPATLQDLSQRSATVGSICGQILYGGTPAKAADIYIYPMGTSTEMRTTAQDEGLWRMPNIAPGLYRVKARFFGAVKEILNVKVVAGADTPGVDFWLGDVNMQTDETPVDEQILNVAVAGSTINADWWARDLLSGILKYEMCIGSAQGLADIKGWTDYGWKQSDSLTKPAGAAYVGLRVTNGAGIVSTPIWKALSGGGGDVLGTVTVKVGILGFSGDFSKLGLAITAARVGQTLTQSTTMDSSGTASFSIPNGTWDITLKPAHALAKKTIGVVLNATANMGTLSFTNGDADGNNSIDLFDYVKLDEAFGSAAIMADVDGSGAVNLFDYVVLDANFGKVGQ